MTEQPGGWDGDGIDPWLPERIATETALTASERRMFASWWGSLSSWMVGVRRSVYGNADLPPQAQAVWAHVPEWAKQMTAFANGPVKDTVGLAYRALFGDSFLFDARPFVTSYLADVVNRMVRTPQQVFDLVAQEVAAGAAKGESIPALAARVQKVLDLAHNEDWHNRAVVIARTETIGALNAGRFDSFSAAAEVLDQPMEQMWLATLDGRTRPAHAHADLQRVPVGRPFIVGGEPLMFPGDHAGSAENVIQCRCTTLLVPPGEDTDLSGRGWKWDDSSDTSAEQQQQDQRQHEQDRHEQQQRTEADVRALAKQVGLGQGITDALLDMMREEWK